MLSDAINFERHRLQACFIGPNGITARWLEVRRDPLLGTSARIAEGVTLARAKPGDLDPVWTAPCPFCGDNLGRLTPKILPEILPERRVRVGDATLFPNLVPYTQYAAVTTFTARHALAIDEFAPLLIADALRANLRYIAAVAAYDPAARYPSLNVNYLYPSGGSLPHPHMQCYLDPFPSTMTRLLLDAGRDYTTRHGSLYWADLAAEEERHGERWIARCGQRGQLIWLTPFAPLGFNEVRAIVVDRSNVLQLDDEDVDAISDGVSRVLGYYGRMGYNSFNLAIYSGPLGQEAPFFSVQLTMITRSALAPYYRSDAMYLERLHWESATDRLPEDIAGELRHWFSVTAVTV